MPPVLVKDIIDSPQIVKAFKDIDNAINSNLKILTQLTKQGATLNKQFSGGAFSAFTKAQQDFNTTVSTTNKIESSNIELLKKKEALQKSVYQANQARLKVEQEEERIKQQKIKTQQSSLRLMEQERKVSEKQAIANAKLTSSYAQLSAKLNQARAKAKDIGATFGTSSKQFKIAQKEVLRLDNSLKKLDSSLGLSQRKVGAYENATKNLTRSLAGLAAGYLGLRAAIRVFRNVIGTLANFEQATTNLATIFGKTRKEISPLIKDAERLGAITAKSATEVVSLQDAYARLGFSQADILKLTEGTIDGSIALNAGLSETATLVGAVVNTFDDFSSSDAGLILDQLTLSTQKSALNFEKLNAAIPIVAGAANAAGIPFSRLVALLGKLSDSGIDASTSATALRNIFIESAADGLSYDQILTKIVNSSDQLTAANDEFGKRAAVSAAVLSKNIKSVSDFDTALQSAGGTASKVAKERLNTLKGSVTLLKSAWEGLILRFQDGNSILKKLVDGLTTFVTFIQNNLTAIGNLVKGIVVATAAFTTWRLAILATTLAQKLNLKSTLSNISINKIYVAATKLATVATKAFSNALRSNPIGLIATVIAGAATALLLFKNKTNEATAASKALLDVNKNTALAFEEESAKLEILRRQLEKTNPNSKERIRLVKEINDQYPDLLGNLDAEKSGLDEINIAFKNYVNILQDKIRLQIIEKELISLIEQRRKVEDDFYNKKISSNERYKEIQAINERNNALLSELEYQQNLVNYSKTFADLKKEEAELASEIESNTGTLIDKLNETTLSYEEWIKTQKDIAKSQGLENTLIDTSNTAYLKWLDNQDSINKSWEDKKTRLAEIRKQLKNELNLVNQFTEPPSSTQQDGKDIFNIELARFETKKLLREKDYIDEKQLLRKKFKEGLIDELTYKEELIKAEFNFNNDIRAIQKEKLNLELSTAKKGSDDKIKLNNSLKEIELEGTKDKYDTQNEIDEINKERRLQFFAEEFEDSIKVIKDGQNKEEAVLEQGYLDGAISYENYRKKLEDIGLESNIEILEAEADFIRKQIELLPEGNKERIRLLQQLAEKEIEIRRIKVDTEIDLEKKKNDIISQLSEDLKQISIDAINTIFENRIQKLQSEGEAIDEETARRLENERLTDEQRAAIEQQATQRKSTLDKRIKEEQRKQAIAQKAFALIDIAQKTAQSITKTLATLGLPAAIPFIAAAGAIGVAQAAIVAAQPIPKFEKGTKSAPGGLAVVSEKGSELVHEPSGKMYLTPDSASLMNIPKGSVITPADKTQKIIENEITGRIVKIDDIQLRRDNKSILKELKNLNKGVRKNRTMITINNSESNYLEWKKRKIG